MITHALISVSDKTGIVEFAQALSDLGVKLLSTGGTAKLLADAGLAVTEVAELHRLSGDARRPRQDAASEGARRPAGAPRPAGAHGGAREARHPDASTCWSSISIRSSRPSPRPSCTLEDAIENIDIGGPAMVRSAAKNWKDVAVRDRSVASTRACSPKCARTATRSATRRNFALAAKAFAHIAHYDGAISDYLSRLTDELQHRTRNASRRTPTSASSSCRTCATARTRTSSAAFYRDLYAAGRLAGELRPAAGQGTLVQQHRRRRRGVGMRQELRRAGLRDRQARQPVRRRDRRRLRRGLREGVQDRSDLGLRRHHRLQPRGRRGGGASRRQAVRRGADRARRISAEALAGVRGQAERARAGDRAAGATAATRSTSSASARAC